MPGRPGLRPAIALLALLLPVSPANAAHYASPSRSVTTRGTRPIDLALVVQATALVRASPTTRARLLATLVRQTQVEVTATRGRWAHIRFWGSAEGWVGRGAIARQTPWPTTSTYRAPVINTPINASRPAVLATTALVTGVSPMYTRPGGSSRGTLPAGRMVWVSAWQQDDRGRVWYRIGGLWTPGAAIQFGAPASARRARSGISLTASVSGKGMWLTLGTVAGSDPDTLAGAAAADGVTHLYVEAAISPLGFHGRHVVGPLIDAAHRHHIRIIAWVFPYLYDVASDVALTRQVAAFRTSAGLGFDGIAADLETNVTLASVRAYSQLIRQYVGNHYLLVGVTYPPQSFPTYPFAEVAHDYDVLAPMDYWHQTKTAVGPDYTGLTYGRLYAERYAQDSIAGIRRLARSIPIAPIGQAFDNFGRLEMGPFAPSGEETIGFLVGCKRGGAIGASFFQWMSVTDAEWRVIRQFRY